MNPFSQLTAAELAAAADRRVSQRAYDGRPVEDEKIELLRACLDAANAAEPCLDFQLYGPLDDAGKAVGINRRMFAGCFHWYAALVCDMNDIAFEKCGYYGEQLILLASHLGLGTCWVAGTFDREATHAEIGDGQGLLAIVPIGYAPDKTPFVQRKIRSGVRSRTKKPAETVESDMPYAELPAWVRAGAEAIIAGPSAVNQEPVVLTWRDGRLTARFIVRKTRPEVTAADFGIAKLDFERLCGRPGRWDWGQGSAYHPDD